MVTGHLYGQAYVESTGQAAALAPVDEGDVVEEDVVEVLEAAAEDEEAEEETA